MKEVIIVTEKEFLTNMKESILDTEIEISMDTPLKDVDEWDSLSVVDFIAMANVALGKSIGRDSVIKAESFTDLYKLIK